MSKKINIHVSMWNGLLNDVVVTGLKDDAYDLEVTKYDNNSDEPNIHTINGKPKTRTITFHLTRTEDWYPEIEVPVTLDNEEDIIRWVHETTDIHQKVYDAYRHKPSYTQTCDIGIHIDRNST